MKVKKAAKSATAGTVKKIKRIDPYSHLPRAARRKITRIVKLAKLRGIIPRSAQHTIAYDELCRNGLVRTGDTYTRTVEFGDVNYRLAKNEEKESIFDSWSKLLNSFDPSLSIQLSFVNQQMDSEQMEKQVALPVGAEALEPLRQEYTQLLRDKMKNGNNGLVRRKFITSGMQSDSREVAEMKLGRVESELLNSLQQIGAGAERCNGYQRMELLHDLYNIGTEKRLNFNWGLIPETGLTTKDFIAPNSFDFRNKSDFALSKRLGRVSYMQIMASELSDDILSELLDMDSPQVITLHIQPIDRADALKQVKGMLSDIQKMTIEEQMKAARQGYDMDILPPDLVDSKDEAEDLLESLQARDERMFLITFLVLHFAEKGDELDNRCGLANQICEKYNCSLLPLDWQQEAGLMASSPIGVNPVKIQRRLTTDSVAIFIPFQTLELFMPGGTYYGINSISGNVIMIDRKAAFNMGGVFLGKSGSGKSFAVKCEMFIVFILYGDDILINDPEREYTPLVQALGGQVIRIAADSKQHINPMDINMNARNDEDKDYDPVRSKSDFILSFCEQVIGGRNGLEPLEISVIDRCVQRIYSEYNKDPRPERMPILGDLYNTLLEQPEPEARRIATGLELYVTGSLNIFNHHTNVDINNRLVCFDTKDLGTHLKKLGMLIVQDQIWSRVTVNRSQGRFTRYYADEFHLLLREPETAAATVEMWKRFRKWGGMPTAITQNVSDFMQSAQVKGILKNSEFFYLLGQSRDDQNILADELEISSSQMSHVNNVGQGEGLIIFKGTIIPFKNEFPTDTQLYRLMTTKLTEVV